MDRYCFRKIIFVSLFSLCLGTNMAWGNCPLADKSQKEGRQDSYMAFLNVCAMQYNDDESQMKLANAYMNGAGIEKNELQAVYIYQLAAESGNAEAQVKLAEILQSFDTTPERRTQLKEHQKRIEKLISTSDGFSGEIQHPYTLLMLASERSENKWYYPSKTRIAPARASAMLASYNITPEKKQMALKDASRWKTRKLLETAKEVLSEEEYPTFEAQLKNSATRTKAMTELKERVEQYVAEKQKERAIPL